MSTPIFDELIREFASRMEEQRTAQQPEQASPQQPAPSAHRHRAD
jgi:hypothetical protein